MFAALVGTAIIFSSCGKEVVEKYDMLKVKGGSVPTEYFELSDMDIDFEKNPDFKVTVSDFYISKYEVTRNCIAK